MILVCLQMMSIIERGEHGGREMGKKVEQTDSGQEGDSKQDESESHPESQTPRASMTLALTGCSGVCLFF